MNYVFFFPDEMRAESLRCYGNEQIETPNYDRLARQGVRFEQCHVQNPVCSPSRCCLFTGQYVHIAGHRTLWNLLKPYEHNLLRYFKEAGYEVRVYGKNDVFSQETIGLSTHEFISHPGTGVGSSKPATENPHDFLYNAMPGTREDHHDYQDLKAGLDFLRTRKPDDKPFVLFLPLSFPHCPYTAPEPYYSLYSPENTPPLREKGSGKPRFHEEIRRYRHLDGTDYRKIQAVYMGMISFTDSLLGELMDCLDETGLAENTMLIASSDHGDYAGDYELVEKWPSGCEDVLTRVPLLIRAPGCAKEYVVHEPVELIDLLPTMLESAGIPLKHTQFGHSLLPQLHGAPGDKNRAVFCEGGYNLNEPQCNEGYEKPGTSFMQNPNTIYYPKGLQQKEKPETVGRAVMIRTMTHKLVRRTYGDHELYDLQKDPRELTNVYGKPEYEGIRLELETRLLDWYLATSDTVPFEEDPRGIQPQTK